MSGDGDGEGRVNLMKGEPLGVHWCGTGRRDQAINIEQNEQHDKV